MTSPDIRDLDRRAVRTGLPVVSQVKASDLDRPTPCAGWTLGDLLAHMTVQHHGFAAAARGDGADPSVWAVRPLAADPVRAYADAADDVLAAFAEPGVMERAFALAEFGEGAVFPARQAIGFHFVDYVVHGWDVARALGLPFVLDDDLTGPALRIALAVPDGDARLRPGAAFRPGLPVPRDATPLDRILAVLGRSPSWPRDAGDS